MANQEDQPWYRTASSFSAQGAAIVAPAPPGFVWVNKEEIVALAELVGLKVDEFERRYVRLIGVRKSLKELDNYDCVFLDGETRKCRVYSARPRQCRTWPFWDSNIRTPQTWAATCEVCPGSGKGKLYQLEQVQEQAAVMRI